MDEEETTTTDDEITTIYETDIQYDSREIITYIDHYDEYYTYVG